MIRNKIGASHIGLVSFALFLQFLIACAEIPKPVKLHESLGPGDGAILYLLGCVEDNKVVPSYRNFFIQFENEKTGQDYCLVESTISSLDQDGAIQKKTDEFSEYILCAVPEGRYKLKNAYYTFALDTEKFKIKKIYRQDEAAVPAPTAKNIAKAIIKEPYSLLRKALPLPDIFSETGPTSFEVKKNEVVYLGLLALRRPELKTVLIAPFSSSDHIVLLDEYDTAIDDLKLFYPEVFSQANGKIERAEYFGQ